MNLQDLHANIVFPGALLGLESQVRLDGISFVRTNQVQCDLFEQREVLRRVVLADHAVVLAETDVEHPVKVVLDDPVRTHSLGQFFSVVVARVDVGSLFELSDLVAGHALRDDTADLLAVGP